MIRKLSDVVELARKGERRRVAVAVAQDDSVLSAARQAVEQGIADFTLFGDEARIREIATKVGLDLGSVELVNLSDDGEATRAAVTAVHEGKCQILMKGLVSTSVYLKHILNKEYGLRTGEVLNHLALFELPTYHKLFIATDAAMNLEPDINTKISIIRSAVRYMQKLGVELPKVAVLGAVEKVNPAMPATVDAAILTQMCRRGQLGKCLVDGPLALDNAVSKEAARIKGIVSDVAGDADILLAHDIDMANVLYKASIYLAGGKSGAVIAGASAPVVLTSRADDDQSKLYSIALAAAIS